MILSSKKSNSDSLIVLRFLFGPFHSSEKGRGKFGLSVSR